MDYSDSSCDALGADVSDLCGTADWGDGGSDVDSGGGPESSPPDDSGYEQ